MGKDGLINLPDTTPEHVAEQLFEKSWEEMEILEHAGYLLFPEKLYKRKADRSFDAVDILLRVPREPDLRKARVLARQIAEKDGIDPERDTDLMDNIEDICILADAIRNTSAPHEPWVPDPRELEKKYDKRSLLQVLAKMNHLSAFLDPQPRSIGKEEMLAVITKIAATNSILPLAVFGSGSDATCIITMARLLVNSPELKSLMEQCEL